MRPQRGIGGVVLVAALLVLAVVSAAVAPPWQLRPRRWLSFDAPVPPVVLPSAPLQPTGRASPPVATNNHPADLSWLPVAGLVLLGLGLVVAGWWLWRRYLSSRVEGRHAGPPGDVVISTSTPEVPVLRRGVEAARRSLDEVPDPNDAIVAAWLALEDAASSSGVSRRPAETPTEFTVDVLRATAADPQATRDLLALYHRARFSAAGVSSTDVRAAGQCLAALASSWSELTPDAVSRAVQTVPNASTDGRTTP